MQAHHVEEALANNSLKISSRHSHHRTRVTHVGSNKLFAGNVICWHRWQLRQFILTCLFCRVYLCRCIRRSMGRKFTSQPHREERVVHVGIARAHHIEVCRVKHKSNRPTSHPICFRVITCGFQSCAAAKLSNGASWFCKLAGDIEMLHQYQGWCGRPKSSWMTSTIRCCFPKPTRFNLCQARNGSIPQAWF